MVKCKIAFLILTAQVALIAISCKAPTSESQLSANDPQVGFEVQQTIAEAISTETETVDPLDVVPEARLTADLGIDELDLVEIVAGLENKFQIEIPDEEIQAWITVQNVIDSVKRKLAS